MLQLGFICAVSLEASLTCITVMVLNTLDSGPVLHASYSTASMRLMRDASLGCIPVPSYLYKVLQPVVRRLV